MKICDLVTIQKNRNNSQISFNLKARQLARIGITPQHLLNLKVPQVLVVKNSIPKPIKLIIEEKEVKKSKWKK